MSTRLIKVIMCGLLIAIIFMLLPSGLSGCAIKKTEEITQTISKGDSPAATEKQPDSAGTPAVTQKLRVFQNAPPPKIENDPNYAYYPLTDAVTAQSKALAASPPSVNVGKYYFLWANRADKNIGSGGSKGNYLYPKLRTDDKSDLFSSYEAANACTLAQAAYVLGLEERIPSIISGTRLTVVKDQSKLPPNPFTDICVLPESPAPSIDGIVLDYEVQDGRTPEMTEKFLLEFAQLVHESEKKAILYTNPLNAPTQKWTGINKTNGYNINKAFDYITILLWSKNTEGNIVKSFYNQLDVIRGGQDNRPDTDKIMINFELNGTTLDDARAVRSLIKENNVSAVIFWNNGADRSTDSNLDSNQKISIITENDIGK